MLKIEYKKALENKKLIEKKLKNFHIEMNKKYKKERNILYCRKYRQMKKHKAAYNVVMNELKWAFRLREFVI